MGKNNWIKFPVLFSLYIAQSVPMSFFSTVVPVIMRQENYSLESIGLLQLVKLPWIIKFLWAPIVDNYSSNFKQLKHWIFFSELFYAFIIIGIGFFSLQTDFISIIVLIIIAFTASATQDIATDIFAIRILKESERGLGNSMQSGGSFMGSLLGTGVLLLIYHYYGWQNLLFILAAFVLFAVIPLWFYKPVEKTQSTEKQTVKLKELLLFFNDKVCRKHLLLLIFYYSGIIGILAMLKPYLVDLGYNVKEIGFMSGIIGTSTAAFSAFFGGFLIKKLGRITSFYIFSFANLSVGVYFYYLSSFVPNFWQISMAICLLWAAYGFSSVIVYTSSMDKVRPQREGTDFTLQIVVTHLSSLIIAVFSGKLGDKFGYNGLFSFQILMSLLAIVILYYNFPLKFKKK